MKHRTWITEALRLHFEEHLPRVRLNNVEPEKWLRYVIEHIQDWPANRVRDLLPWKVDLSSQ